MIASIGLSINTINSRASTTLAGSRVLALRATTLKQASARTDILDCATYIPDTQPLLPQEQTLFTLGSATKLTPDDGKQYTAASWAPTSNAVLFVTPTNNIRPIVDHDAAPSDDSPQLQAVSKNELLLYTLSTHQWEQVTADGTRPTWSALGRTLYYMSGIELTRFDRATKTASRTGLQAPDTAAGLALSQPLPDGKLLAPRQAHGPTVVQNNAQETTSVELGVTEYDQLVPSPSGDRVVIAYGATTQKGQVTPALTELQILSGATIALMKNCQDAALQIA